MSTAPDIRRLTEAEHRKVRAEHIRRGIILPDLSDPAERRLAEEARPRK